MTAILEVRSLSKHFGGLAAVDAVSFELADGDIAALIGANGAGKTTCFNMLGGALQADTGHVFFQGQNITDWPAHRRCRSGIGRTFQIAATFRSMSVLENVETALSAIGRDTAAAPRLLDETGIADKAGLAVTALAYGDIKRVELAMVLAAEPRLLLLDEPTAGMAGAERRQIMQTIAGLVAARGMTVLFTEHDMDAVFGFARRVLVMDQGQLIADGSPDAVRGDARVQQVYLGDAESDDA
ncbi:MAG: ABC transporter ATP-binding protein [Rhodospirillales bacterium]